MATIGNINISLTADLSDLVRDMKSAAQAVGEAGYSMQKAIAAELIADGLKAIAGAALDLGKRALTMAGELEQSKVGFTTMLGSAEKADAFLRELADFAANTPFEMRGLQESSKKLLAFGFDARDIIPIMTSVGDAVSGLGGGAAEINRVTMALGQMQAKGKVSAEEMMQLAELGIPAWDMLAKQIGVSVPEAMKMAEKGAIPAGKAITGLVEGMTERFGGLMDKQSKTMLGALSNLQDGADQVLTKLGTKFVETFHVTPLIANLAGAFSDFSANLDSLGLLGSLNALFGPEMKAAILGIGVAVTAAMVPAMISAGAALAGAVTAAAPFILAAAAIAAAVYPIIKNWEELKQEFQAIFNGIVAFVGDLYERVRSAFMAIGNAAGGAVKFIADKLRPLWNLLPDEAKAAISQVGGAVLELPQLVIKPIAGVASAVGASARSVGGSLAGAFGSGLAEAQKFVKGLTSMPAAVKTNVVKPVLHLKDAVTDSTAAAAKAAKEMEKELKKSLKRGEDSMKAFGKRIEVFADLHTSIKGARADFRLFGDAIDLNSSIADSYKKAMRDLINQGLDPLNPVVQKLRKQWAEYTKAADAAKKATEIETTFTDVSKALDTASIKAGAFGKSFDLAGERTRLLESALHKLIEQGVSPADQRFKDLQATLEASRSPMDGFRQSTTDVMTAIQGLKDGLGTITEALGIPMDNAWAENIKKSGDFVLAVVQVQKAIETLGPALVTMGGDMLNLGTSVWKALPGLVEYAGALWGTVIPATIKWAAATVVATWPLLAAAAAVGVVVAAVVWLGDSIIKSMGGMAKAWDFFSRMVMFLNGVIWESMKQLGQAIGTGLASVVQGAWNGVLGFIKSQINGVIGLVNFMIRALNAVKFQAPDWVPHIGGMGWQGPQIPQIPMLAAGGLAVGASPAIVGEGKWKEAILPLSPEVLGGIGAGAMRYASASPGAAGGGGNTFMTVHVTLNGGATRQDGEALWETLVKTARRHGVTL